MSPENNDVDGCKKQLGANDIWTKYANEIAVDNYIVPCSSEIYKKLAAKMNKSYKAVYLFAGVAEAASNSNGESVEDLNKLQ